MGPFQWPEVRGVVSRLRVVLRYQQGWRVVLTLFRVCVYTETREFDILLLMVICDSDINKEVVFAAAY